VTAVAAERPQGRGFTRQLRRNGWTAGAWVFLALLVILYATLLPRFTGFEQSSLIRSGLPIALLAMAQALVVLSGGVDLSLGALLVLANCLAVRLMLEQGLGVALAAALGIVLVGMAVQALVGLVIDASGVPDIVVTLAMSFVYSGVALFVAPSPLSGVPEAFRALVTGSASGFGTNFVPPLVILVVALVAVWFLVKRSRVGLTLYAAGSDRQAAYLSGVNVRRARVTAYLLAGLLTALAGVLAAAITGGAQARYSVGASNTLNSVAAVVVGGVALTGGRGSPLGAAAAGYALSLLAPIFGVLGLAPTDVEVVRGVVIVVVVMLGGVLELRRANS
jgi:ribose transport system permease protein